MLQSRAEHLWRERDKGRGEELDGAVRGRIGTAALCFGAASLLFLCCCSCTLAVFAQTDIERCLGFWRYLIRGSEQSKVRCVTTKQNDTGCFVFHAKFLLFYVTSSLFPVRRVHF